MTRLTRKPTRERGNIPRLREKWIEAERAWRDPATAKWGEQGIYREEAEGREIKRGGVWKPDEMRKLFLAAQRAREAYFDGVDG